MTLNESSRYKLNPFNHEPRIQLIDGDSNLIQMISQIEAFHLLRYGFCELLMVNPPTLQFQLDRKDWDVRFMRLKPPRWFRDSGRHLEARKSIMYGNYHIQSPEGNEMFHCNAQKALWYLNRDIADVVGDNPPTLRLKFVPGGPGHVGDAYYLTEKLNRCVVCASERNLNRHHVMPRVFRKHLPECIKDHNYHDVLLMCIDCHEQYEEEADKLKQKICRELEFDINNGAGQIYLPDIGNAVKAARALFHYEKVIPEPRKSILLNTLREYLKKDEITPEDLKEVSSHFSWRRPDGYKGYGEFVVSKIGDIQEFTERWRQHFIDVMKPKYLPIYWDVKKPLVRDRVRSK
jgi:hypothetical protein